MPRRALKDTYGIDRLTNPGGDELEIRRKVVAGQLVPDNLEVDAGDVEDLDALPAAGYQQWQIRGTPESDEMLRAGIEGHEEHVLPGDAEQDDEGEPVPHKGKRPAKSGATAAVDRAAKKDNDK